MPIGAFFCRVGFKSEQSRKKKQRADAAAAKEVHMKEEADEAGQAPTAEAPAAANQGDAEMQTVVSQTVVSQTVVSQTVVSPDTESMNFQADTAEANSS